MKIYLLETFDQSNGLVRRWHPSKATAELALRKVVFARQRPRDELDTISVCIVPTRRVELLRWLNKHARTR